MRTLLVGHGAREAALATSIVRDSELFSLARIKNPTLEALSSELRLATAYSVPEVVGFAKAVRPDFVMIGPEEPLALGVVDALEEAGFWSCGPSRSAAKLEWDKSFMRGFLSKHLPNVNVPYVIAQDGQDVESFFATPPWLAAVKPIGLSGGKGVKVQGINLSSKAEAVGYAQKLIENSGNPVLLEQKVSAIEFTLHCLTDGKHTSFFSATYDYSYREAADSGPQTGGMGSYCVANPNLPFLKLSEYHRCCDTLSAVIRALQQEGIEYKGVLQGQFFFSQEGFKICEFACRFGDPEATNLIPLLVPSWNQVMHAIKNGELKDGPLEALPLASVTFCLVPPGYPLASDTNQVFNIPANLLEEKRVTFFPGGCERAADGYRCLGGRAGAITSQSDDLEPARRPLKEILARIDGVQYRADIAAENDIKQKIELAESFRRGGSSGENCE
jgi:phosphoribosylamine--glycine ligase